MLMASRVQEIEDIAEAKLRSSFGSAPLDIRLPVDVFAVAKEQGLEIVEAQFADQDVSGSFDGSVIRVAQRDDIERKAFTVAHECGHSVLHASGLEGKVEVLYRRDLDDPMAAQDLLEAEANVFAAALLMPRKIVRAFERKSMGVSQMADTFAVSTRAMEYRLMHLEEYLGSL
jgi:Zn-dependent peptidase ImmA (M78 family)